MDQRMVRGKNIKTVNFECPKDMQELRAMCLSADVLLDPYRPGVLESLGLDPVWLLMSNPRLIIARITGYGQSGPMAMKAGHDINYVAMSGLLPSISSPQHHEPPANLLADFAGGGLMAAFGVAAALFHRQSTEKGVGGVLDCSMAEGVAYLGTFVAAYSDVELLFGGEYSVFSGRCPIYRWVPVPRYQKENFKSDIFKDLRDHGRQEDGSGSFRGEVPQSAIEE